MLQPTKQGLLGKAPAQPAANGSVSEKDKADFQQFIAQGMKVLHAPETRDTMLKRLTQGNPIQAIAEVTLTIVQKLEGAAQVSDIVKLDGANVIMREVAELAEAAGVKPLSDEEKSTAFSLALEMYVMQGVKSGKMNPEELQQVAGQTPPQGGMQGKNPMPGEMMGGQNGPA